MTAAHAQLGLMSLDQWRALPEEPEYRVELQEGVRIVSPRPTKAHARAVFRLCAQVDEALPAGWEALPEVEVVIDSATPATVRVPDIVVCRSDAPEPLVAADVAIAIEIVSPGSRRTDHVTKRSEYADAGIAHYWIVDLGRPTTLTPLTLTDHGYSGVPVTGHHTSTTPFPLTISLTF
ncbi:Uma2 family endonuclease [Gordonia polyisoprenivorans]|uniref:Uma2 family endonuclease n=1 Tax=Gordonia polyisoprenivorans TaxID=84595 RepID=UPI00230098D5|nr:Uma2 family endonuclease [Gordonia polyisoprenivorans]WCB39225.1 Uma2 family endonuclease [Gordonia polyisoprenivorans]